MNTSSIVLYGEKKTSSRKGNEPRIFGEIAKACGNNQLTAVDTAILGALAVAPEPLRGLELLQVSSPGAVRGGTAHMEMEAAVSFFADRGVLTIGGMSVVQNLLVANVNLTDYIEMTWKWKKLIADSKNPFDMSTVQASARSLVLARSYCSPRDAPMIWLYAPYFLAKGEMYHALHEFLVNPENFNRMREATSDSVRIPVWCEAIWELTSGRPSVTRHWKRMVACVLPEVLQMLQAQRRPIGWLQNILLPLAKLLKPFSNEALLNLFETAMDDLNVTQQRQRAGLALVQLFCEVGDFERAEGLAREQFKEFPTVENAHFLAIVLFGKGQSGCAKDRKQAIRECIRIEERYQDVTSNSNFQCLSSARSLLSRAHRTMHTLCMLDEDEETIKLHRALAFECVEALALAFRSFRYNGYRALVHHQFGDTTRAWEIAKIAAERSPCSMEANTVLLDISSSFPLHRYFVSYCRLQAIAWFLSRCPYEYEPGYRPSNAAVRWAIRENVLPMAVELDAARAEKISPGITSRCAIASRGTKRISVGAKSGILIADMRVWEFEEADVKKTVVLELPEFGMFARGHTMDAAASNLQQIIQVVQNFSEQSGQYLPDVQRLARWLVAHSFSREEEDFVVSHFTNMYQAGRIRKGYTQISEQRAKCVLARPWARVEFERVWCWYRAENGDKSAFDDAFALLDWPSSLQEHFTDLQKVGVNVGLTPHPIVKSVHEQFELLGLASCSQGFAALEKLYWGLYLLGQEDNSSAEAAIDEALTIEIGNLNDRHMLARMGDALAESLRRRGDIVLAVRILRDNIRYREDTNISAAPSYVQISKCSDSVEAATANLVRARQLYGEHNPKELIRVLLLEARITSDKKRQERNFGRALRMAQRYSGIKEDPKFQEIVSRWDDWCRVSYSPELSYWGL